MPIYINQPRGKLVTRIAANSTNGGVETITLASANTSAEETVNALQISKVYWSGNVTIGRGNAGGTRLFNLTGGGNWDFDVAGITQTEQPTTNVVITYANNATVYVELKKQSTLATP
jgi:hypothetical protein